MIRDIILYPDERLETPCDPVEAFDTGDLRQLVADMFEAMYFHRGIGLAAPQIGVMKQVAVIDPSSGKDSSKKIVLINPTITDMQGTQRGEEGCLCFPGFVEQVTRSMNVIVDARDTAGAAVHLQSNGLLSRALQHEIDHLHGILFIRRMSALKRELIRRKIRKLLHAGTWKSIQPHKTD
jgi:peptide deformylase